VGLVAGGGIIASATIVHHDNGISECERRVYDFAIGTEKDARWGKP
jgi:hypothetical protein